MPAVLKMARQINHASCSWRALFQRAISFQTPSQIARTMTTATSSTTSGAFMLASIIARNGGFIFLHGVVGLLLDEITGRLPLSIFFQIERDGFNRGFFLRERGFKLHHDI